MSYYRSRYGYSRFRPPPSSTPKRLRAAHSARIFWFAPLKGWGVVTPYLKDPKLRKNLNLLLDFTCGGRYEPRARCWICPEDQLEQIKHVFAQFQILRYEFREKKTFAMPAAPDTRDYRSEFLTLVGESPTVTLTAELLQLLYKRAARRLHPDVGGDHEAMSNLNICYSALRERTGRTAENGI